MTFIAPYTGLEFALRIDGTTPSSDFDGADFPVLQPGNGDPDTYAWAGKTLIPFTNTVIDPAQEVFVRYRVDTANITDPEIAYDTTYTPITIRSMTVTATVPGVDGVFVTNTGAEWSNANVDAAGVAGWVSSLQTTDTESFTTEFDFYRVFDQSVISYLPFQSSYDAEPVVNQAIPSEPYDPDADPPVLPIDVLFELVPDPRNSVTVEWVYTFTYSLNNASETSSATIKIEQTLSQPVQDWGSVIRGYQERSSFSEYFRPLKGVPDPNDHVLEWNWYDDDLNIADDDVEHVTIIPED